MGDQTNKATDTGWKPTHVLKSNASTPWLLMRDGDELFSVADWRDGVDKPSFEVRQDGKIVSRDGEEYGPESLEPKR